MEAGWLPRQQQAAGRGCFISRDAVYSHPEGPEGPLGAHWFSAPSQLRLGSTFTEGLNKRSVEILLPIGLRGNQDPQSPRAYLSRQTEGQEEMLVLHWEPS